MANLRSSRRPLFRQPQGSSVVPLPRARATMRWLWLVVAAGVALLLLAWTDGGETPLRPIAQPVDLSEPPQ